MGDDPIGPQPDDSSKSSSSLLLPLGMAFLPSVMLLLMITFNVRSVLVATVCFVLSVVFCLRSSFLLSRGASGTKVALAILLFVLNAFISLAIGCAACFMQMRF